MARQFGSYFTRALQSKDKRYAQVYGKLGYRREEPMEASRARGRPPMEPTSSREDEAEPSLSELRSMRKSELEKFVTSYGVELDPEATRPEILKLALELVRPPEGDEPEVEPEEPEDNDIRW